VTLVDDLRRSAGASGDPLGRLGIGRDRYGPVAAILFAPGGYVGIRRRDDGGYTVVIWVGDDPVAWGNTSSLDEIVTTLRGWQDSWSVQALCEAAPYLVATNQQAAVDVLWDLLITHGEPHLRAIVTKAAAYPALRALRPWIGHGTLHLLHSDDSVDAERRGLAFLPADETRFKVFAYDGATGPIEDTETAAATAAAYVTVW
jgi:hypothetical protein